MKSFSSKLIFDAFFYNSRKPPKIYPKQDFACPDNMNHPCHTQECEIKQDRKAEISIWKHYILAKMSNTSLSPPPLDHWPPLNGVCWWLWKLGCFLGAPSRTATPWSVVVGWGCVWPPWSGCRLVGKGGGVNPPKKVVKMSETQKCKTFAFWEAICPPKEHALCPLVSWFQMPT